MFELIKTSINTAFGGGFGGYFVTSVILFFCGKIDKVIYFLLLNVCK